MAMIARASEKTGNDAVDYIIASGTRRTEHYRFDARQTAHARARTGIQRQIADLAERLVTIEPGAIDDAVAGSLGLLTEELRLDHTIMWRSHGDAVDVVASHFGIKHPLRSLPDPRVLAGLRCVASKLQQSEAAFFTRLDEVTDELDRSAILRLGLRSAAVVPVALTGGAPGERGALAFVSTTKEYEWTPEIVEQLRLVAGVFGQALARKNGHEALRRALDEVRQLREQAAGEDAQGRPGASGPRFSHLIVSSSPAVRHAIAQAELVARTPATVLLLGETGVGKEVFARAIHEHSPRGRHQMIRVNCAAIPGALIESELFGRERGAYTGAVTRQIGRFEAANLSTIFLDEIGDLPLEVQAKLLRAIQDRVIERLGSSQMIKVDVRIIAATNRNLEQAVADKLFREDLFYRLNVFPITVPPLRERLEDIQGLVWEFIDEFSQSLGKPIESISKDSMRQLEHYAWPGNVRELRNVIERAVILATGPRLTVPMPAVPRQPQAATSLADVQLEHIRGALDSANWRIRGKGGAAERLGLKPTTLESRMAKLGLVRPTAGGFDIAAGRR
jgi:formate hydrogenlyase transcriptional activator